MQALRRTDFEPRLEMMPLIDVIFLLLTFFIYNLLISASLEKLPVAFTNVATGQKVSASGEMLSVTLDPKGDFYWGKDKVSTAELDARLAHLAEQNALAKAKAGGWLAPDAGPTLYLIVDAKGDVDRAPLVIDLIERVKRSGVTNVTFVGQPKKKQGGPDSPGTSD